MRRDLLEKNINEAPTITVGAFGMSKKVTKCHSEEPLAATKNLVGRKNASNLQLRSFATLRMTRY